MALVLRRAIFYATQQGTSKEVAEQIGSKIGIDVHDIATLKTEDFDTYSTLIFVVSSYGRGDPPASAKPFWQFLSGLDPAKKFSGIKFAVFGCGSTNFKRSFVGFAKKVEEALKNHGCQEIAELGIKDDNDEESCDLDQWITSLKL